MKQVNSDLFGLEPIWRVWPEPICIGCGSGNLIGGVEWILRLWSSWSASRISNQKKVAIEEGSIRCQNVVLSQSVEPYNDSVF